MTGIPFQLDPEVLRPIVQAVVVEVVGQLEADRARLSQARLADTEAKASGMLSFNENE